MKTRVKAKIPSPPKAERPAFEDWLKTEAKDGAANLQEEANELIALQALQEEAEGYSSDWRHGATLIRDSHFQDYARQFAEDIGAIPDDAKWPATCIDWEEAAGELQQDYTSVNFDNVIYWVQ